MVREQDLTYKFGQKHIQPAWVCKLLQLCHINLLVPTTNGLLYNYFIFVSSEINLQVIKV